MDAHDTARETPIERVPEAPRRAAPSAGAEVLSAAGNRAIARAVVLGTAPRALIAPGGRLLVARAPRLTAAPAVALSRDERELSDNDKERLRTMVVARLRGTASKLADPKKADLPRIARHLKPVEGVLNGFAAGGEARGTLSSVAADVRMVALAAESAGGSVKSAVRRAVARWQAARRQLGAARSAIAGEIAAISRRKPGEPDPEGVDREQMTQDVTHLKALQEQMTNAVRDLAEAPRNEEALKEVLETHMVLEGEMDALGDLKPAPASARVDAALQAFADGIAALVPFATGREELLHELRKALQTAANTVAGLVGDATEDVEPDPDADPAPSVDPDPPVDPAPSPNPLPPPPPPPPGQIPNAVTRSPTG